jgi:hypothetical protein
MLTKERLAETFRRVSRIFPGIPSYEDREALRTQDKVIRGRLAAELDLQIARVERLKGELTNEGHLSPLAALDRLTRRLQRLTDMIRFARYGYSGMNATNPINEEKLAKLYEYDLSLAGTIEGLDDVISSLVQRSGDGCKDGAPAEVNQAVDRLEDQVNGRDAFFQSP